jgi:hypothetical protein
MCERKELNLKREKKKKHGKDVKIVHYEGNPNFEWKQSRKSGTSRSKTKIKMKWEKCSSASPGGDGKTQK